MNDMEKDAIEFIDKMRKRVLARLISESKMSTKKVANHSNAHFHWLQSYMNREREREKREAFSSTFI